MKRVLKWAGVGLAGVAVFVVCALLGAAAASEAVIRWPVKAPPSAVVASTDPLAIARGRKIAVVEGCHDCHGADFGGKLFHDEPAIVKAWAPNLTLVAARHSDAELDHAIRHGVGADGRRLWMMPSEAFAELSDQESADLIAYLRTFKPHGQAQPRFQVGPIGRLGVLLGKFRSTPDNVLAQADISLPDAGEAHANGRRMARACVECHGQELKGGGALNAPDLMVAAAYEPEDFERLMRTGVAAGGRKVGLMSDVAPVRFNVWSSAEIADLHGYLKARAGKVIAEADAHPQRSAR